MLNLKEMEKEIAKVKEVEKLKSQVGYVLPTGEEFLDEIELEEYLEELMKA